MKVTRMDVEQAKNDLDAVMDRVENGEVIILTEHGTDITVLLPMPHYERLRMLDGSEGSA